MTWTIASDIGRRLIQLREMMGWTQPDLGYRAGRSYKQVIEWEKGRRRPPKTVLERLATEQGWSVEMFAEGGQMPAVLPGRPLTAPDGPESPTAPLAPVLVDLTRDYTRHGFGQLYGMAVMEMADALERRVQVDPDRVLKLLTLVFEAAQRELIKRPGAVSSDRVAG